MIRWWRGLLWESSYCAQNGGFCPIGILALRLLPLITLDNPWKWSMYVYIRIILYIIYIILNIYIEYHSEHLWHLETGIVDRCCSYMTFGHQRCIQLRPWRVLLCQVPWLAVYGNHDFGEHDPYAICPHAQISDHLLSQSDVLEKKLMNSWYHQYFHVYGMACPYRDFLKLVNRIKWITMQIYAKNTAK